MQYCGVQCFLPVDDTGSVCTGSDAQYQVLRGGKNTVVSRERSRRQGPSCLFPSNSFHSLIFALRSSSIRRSIKSTCCVATTKTAAVQIMLSEVAHTDAGDVMGHPVDSTGSTQPSNVVPTQPSNVVIAAQVKTRR